MLPLPTVQKIALVSDILVFICPTLHLFQWAPNEPIFISKNFLMSAFLKAFWNLYFFKHFPEINPISSHGLCLRSSYIYLGVNGFDLLFCVHSNYSIPLVFVPARLVNVLYLGLPLLSDSRFIVGPFKRSLSPPCKMRGIKTWSLPVIFWLHISKLAARLAR